MKGARSIAILIAIVAAGLLPACASRRVQTPERPGQTQAVLLPDSDSKAVGRAIVSNDPGSATLAAPRESTVVSAGNPPGPVTVLSESEVERLFGDAVKSLPPGPQRFTLFFRFESDELTAESRALVSEILVAVRERPVPDLIIIGHTDTTGTSAANVELGRTRALMVRGLLVEAGVNAAVIEVASHGESDLQVQTADETLEPRNRRVEISVR
jgi:outer membrane protein OmpA-like peptidoglycan-associated protein